jgi:ABC-type polysaccharide/polyol phosphate transport system ATPase subunit
MGKNGSGKTTLLRILSKIYDKTSGNLEINDEPAALLKFSIEIAQDLEVAESIFLFGSIFGITKNVLTDQLDHIYEITELRHMAFSPLKDLSTGQRQRLILSVFSLCEKKFLLLDECMASTDDFFNKQFSKRLDHIFSPDRTVVMTSHDSNFLRKYCSKAIWLEEGRILAQGNAYEIIDQYEAASKKT